MRRAARGLLLTLAGTSALEARDPGPRLLGLERLYFERLPGPAASHASVAKSIHSDGLKALLPETLATDRRYWRTVAPEDFGSELIVRDFRLPWQRKGKEVLLRQVGDVRHRLAEQWWMLYENGRRVDGWYFVPAPDRTDNKLLTNLVVESVAQPQAGRLVFRTCGTMVRPQGAWWMKGADLAFSVSGAEIRLDHVLDLFFVSRGYDLGEVPPLNVKTEGRPESQGNPMVEVRIYDDVPAAVAQECGLDSGGDEPDSCEAAEVMARCVTARPEARVERRDAREPSFIERGTSRKP